MVNNNLNSFIKAQRKANRQYLQGVRNNQANRTANPEYNNGSDTDISVGATGREPFNKE